MSAVLLAAAVAFVPTSASTHLFAGAGKRILEAAGLRYFARPRIFKGKQSA